MCGLWSCWGLRKGSRDPTVIQVWQVVQVVCSLGLVICQHSFKKESRTDAQKAQKEKMLFGGISLTWKRSRCRRYNIGRTATVGNYLITSTNLLRACGVVGKNPRKSSKIIRIEKDLAKEMVGCLGNCLIGRIQTMCA